MKAWDVFSSPTASARLLSDLVEFSDARGHEAAPEKHVEIETDLVLPLDGEIDVSAPSLRGRRRIVSPGQLCPLGGRESVTVRAGCARPVRFLDTTMLDFVQVFQMARTLDPQLRPHLFQGSRAPTSHVVWVSAEGEAARVVEPLAHLLAGSIASQFDEAAAVVTLLRAGDTLIDVYVGERFVRLKGVRGVPAPDWIVSFLNDSLVPDLPQFYHLFHVHPAAPQEPVPGLCEDRFDRIVHIATELPEGVPPALEPCLRLAARNRARPGSPYFCSFIPTIVPRHGGFAPRRRRGKGYDVYRADPATRPPDWRLVRDVCHLDVDLATVRRAWVEWRRERRASFPATLLREAPGSRASVARWARATTNRQVGVALSGGGASAYRFVPVLEEFDAVDGGRERLPVDVLSGVSGGALLGAYYAAGRLRQFVADAPLLQVAVVGFILRSSTIRRFVNWRLGHASTADLPVRFVPAAVALPRRARPETRVLVDWDIGDAVEASGSLPVAFAPSKIHGDGYADGAFGTVIPAQVLRDYGADMVIAVNCIEGPALGGGLDASIFGDLLRSTWVVRRMVHLWMSLAYLLQESSRLVEQVPFVHVFVSASETEAPFFEMPRFACAADIMRKARNDGPFMAGVKRCLEVWQAFRRLDAELPPETSSSGDEKMRATTHG
jgi:predicted acylesterase/phospholipase RssA